MLFQQIMKDRWINAGSDEDELKPFVEPELDIRDQTRIGALSRLNTSLVGSQWGASLWSRVCVFQT